MLPSFSHRRLPSNSVCIVFLSNTLLYSRLVLAKNTMQDFPTTRTQLPVTEFERKRKCCRSVYGHKIKRRIYKRKRQNLSFSMTKTKVETRQLVATIRITKMPTASPTCIIIFQPPEGFKRPSDGVLLYTSMFFSHLCKKATCAVNAMNPKSWTGK